MHGIGQHLNWLLRILLIIPNLIIGTCWLSILRYLRLQPLVLLVWHRHLYILHSESLTNLIGRYVEILGQLDG